ncbi:MAG: cation:proton antiporter, partial [Flammeovirgaceae bacterium]
LYTIRNLLAMTDHPIFAFTAALIILFGLFSHKSEHSIITPPMVFVLVGVLVSLTDLELLAAGTKAPYVKILAELALIFILFVDASTLNLKRVIRERQLPLRLLGIGLPLTMLAGFAVAWLLFPQQNLWQLLLLALILSPTDAALGQAVVTSSRLPEKVRQTINVESGLNDGIALPPILVCLAVLSGAHGEQAGASYWLVFVLKQFVFGTTIGIGVGWLGGWLIRTAREAGWMNNLYTKLSSLALAILAYSLAEYLHGNGFIAAYFSGLLLGYMAESIREQVQEFGEAESHIMTLMIFLLFGMLLVPKVWGYWSDWRVMTYALLSLTVIRVIPAYTSLAGTDLPSGIKWFIGWFGPRGIASVLYLIMAILQLGGDGYEIIISTVTLTVLLSIVSHGVSAVPLSRTFGKTDP